MTNFSLVFFFIVPLAMGLGGFFASRRLRVLENAPIFSLMFSRRKLLFSVVIGLFMGLFFTLLLSFQQPFSYQQLLLSLELSCLAGLGYHAGVTLGWGTVSLVSAGADSSNAVRVDSLPENIHMQEMPDAIRIVVRNKEKKGGFAFQWFALGFFAFPLLGLMLFSLSQQCLPPLVPFFILALLGGLALYLAYLRFQTLPEHLYDQEVIEIDTLSVRVELSGAGFKSSQMHPAGDILRITTFSSLFDQVSASFEQSLSKKTGIPPLLIWRTRGAKRMVSFGKGIAQADAQRILGIIHEKFPQYRG